MMDIVLKGCGTAMFTPFRHGKVDVAALIATTERQVQAGIDFLVPLGTTGETPTLSNEERLLVFRTVKEHAAGRPVVVGVGTNSIHGTLANMEVLKEADAYLVVVPFYNKPPQRGIYAYFKTLAEATDKPIILYNVPGRTGANCEAATTLALARDVENIVAVKEASGNRPQVEAILKGRPEGFSVLSGNDDEALDVMLGGGQGVISVVSNLVPDRMAAMYRAFREGALAEAKAIRDSLMPLCESCVVESYTIPVKAGLSVMGLCGPEMRLPLTPAIPATVRKMEELLK